MKQAIRTARLAVSVVALLICVAAHAQQARVVTACGSLAPFGPDVVGTNAFPTIDTTGKLCLSSSGGGAGTLTAGTTPTSGFTAGQLLMSDGSLLQAAGAGTATSIALGSTPDVILQRDAAGILGDHNSTTAQAFRAYNTFTDASNGEWAALDWKTTANVLTIGTQKNGTGISRNISVSVGGSIVAGFSPLGLTLTGGFNVIGTNGGSAQMSQFESIGTPPTAAGAGGTCATGVRAGGSTVGTVTLTGLCAAGNTVALTLQATNTGYVCEARDRTTPASLFQQTATATTGATFTVGGTSTGATDVIQYMCMAY